MLYGSVPLVRSLRPFPLIAGLPVPWYQTAPRSDRSALCTQTRSALCAPSALRSTRSPK
jgi:hypothetical protein